jgi:hypothetical protein
MPPAPVTVTSQCVVTRFRISLSYSSRKAARKAAIWLPNYFLR